MSTRVWLFGVLLVTLGCNARSASEPPVGTVDASRPSPVLDSAPADAEPPLDSAPADAPPPVSDAAPPPTCSSFSSQVDTCTMILDHDITFAAGSTYNTTTPALDGAPIDPNLIPRTTMVWHGVEVEVLLAHDVHIPTGTFRAIGARPLAILASGMVTIGDGVVIDLSDGGAGGRMSCPSFAGQGQDLDGGAGGGGGGGFAAAGGHGGNGNGDNDPAFGPSVGGAGSVGNPTTDGIVVGGCPGGYGGSVRRTQQAPRGLAGGTIYIAAGAGIVLGDRAVINVGGGGGHHGTNNDGGGGGGGTGGMIELESPRIAGATAILAANGGGGGGGTDAVDDAGHDGLAGQASTTQAAGGAGTHNATAGGAGGALAHEHGNDVDPPKGGGGGGGGGSVGYIRVRAADPTLGTCSPAPMISP